MLSPFLLGNPCQHCQRGFVKFRTGQSEVAFWQAPFFVSQCLSRKHCLINIDDSVALLPDFVELAPEPCFLFGLFLFVHDPVFLVPTILQLLDAFLPINLSEQSWVQMTPRKFLGKVCTSVL